MIKLDRPQKPIELTHEVQASLTNKFKEDGNSVWSKEYIKKSLIEMSSNKCAFCETLLGEESKYLEVEHFHHKDQYKDEVVDWDNLLPSCRRCNGKKGTHDTKLEPIINPCTSEPKNHLKLLMNYRFKHKDDIGKLSITLLNLNDQDRLVKKRFEIGNALLDKVLEYIELTDDVVAGVQTNTRRKSKIKNGMEAILRNGLKDKEYSATYSTVLIQSEEFNELKKKMILTDLWTSEHKDLESQIKNLILC
ncbi:TPA: HNH endonuclease [Vibrio diabolicus]